MAEFSDILEYDAGNTPPPKAAPKIDPRQAKKDAFYATAISGTTEHEKVYNQILDDINKQGYSDLVENIRGNWVKEQEDYNKKYVIDNIQDPNVPLEKKKAVIEAYRDGGLVDKNLQTKFVEGMSSLDAGYNKEDTAAQEHKMLEGPQPNGLEYSIDPTTGKRMLVIQMSGSATPEAGSDTDIANGETQRGFLDQARQFGIAVKEATVYGFNREWEISNARHSAKDGTLITDTWATARTIGSGLAHTAVAGYAGIFAIDPKDASAADAIVKDIQKNIYRGNGEGYEKNMAALAELGKLIDIPFKAMGDWAYETFDSPFAGSMFYAVPQAFGYSAAGYVGVKATLKGAELSVAATKALKAGLPWNASDKKLAEQYDIELGPSGETYYKEKVKQATGRVEPTITNINEIDPDSPAGVIGMTNPRAAVEMGVSAVRDITGKVADSMDTTKAEILSTWLLSKPDPELKEIFPDIYEALIKRDKMAETLFKDADIDPKLFDTTAINDSVDKYFSIVKEQTEATMNLASSHVALAGDTLNGKIVFTRNDGYGWADKYEVFAAAKKLNNSLKEAGLSSKKKGESDTGGYQHSQIKAVFDDTTKEYHLEWEFNRKFDPIEDTWFGAGGASAKFGPWNVNALAASDFGKWLLDPSTRLPEWTTAGFARADIRATRTEKFFVQNMRERILSHKGNKELAQAIYKSEEQGKVFTTKELQEMFPHLSQDKFKGIVEGYTSFRRLDEYLWNITNRGVRAHHIRIGNKGLYNGDEFVGIGRKVLVKDLKTPPLEAYDLGGKIGVPFTGEKYLTENGKQLTLVQLDSPLFKDGSVYRYAYVDNANGPLPKQIVPQIAGHFPHINKEPYYISGHPSTMKIDGKEVDYNADTVQEMREYAQTFGVARTQKEADEFAARLAKEKPDWTFWGRAERYDNVDDTLTDIRLSKFNLDAAKARREERLRTIDGSLGRIEDPLVAMHKRMQEIIRLDAWKDIDFEFRRSFTNSYKQFTKEGKFPESAADLVPLDNPSRIESRQFSSAKRLLENYLLQQHLATTGEKWQKSLFMHTARALEDIPIIADFVRAGAKGQGLTGIANKIATIKFIHLNPQRQWLVQPAQVTELVPMALATGNTKFVGYANQVAIPLFSAILGKTKLAGIEVNEFFTKNRHEGTGLSKEEFDNLVDAFEKTGIPFAIDLNSVLHGVLKDAGRGIDESPLEKAAATAKGVGMFIPNISKTLGFSGAELLNNIFLFLYAKGDFETQFPNKKWNDPHNLENIATKAWAVGNTMQGRSSIFPYQKGALRSIMQFASYPQKAIMQPFSSKFLTTREKVALFTTRAFLFGKKGISGVTVLGNAIDAAIPKDAVIPSELPGQPDYDRNIIKSWWENGMLNEMLNGILHMSFDKPSGAKTQIDIRKDINPLGETGVPYGEIVLSLYKLAKQEKDFSKTIPSFSAISSIHDVANDMITLWQVKPIEKWDNTDYLKFTAQIADVASGMNNYEKAMAMNIVKDYEFKSGQKLGLTLTNSEVILKYFGIDSAKVTVAFDLMEIEKHRNKYMDDTARKIINSLASVEQFYGTKEGKAGVDNSAILQEQARINFLVSLYAKDGTEVELMEKVMAMDKKREQAGVGSILRKIMSRHDLKYDQYRLLSAKSLAKIRESDPAAAQVLEAMQYEIRHPNETE